MHTSLWFTDYNKEYHSEEQIFYTPDELPILKELQDLYPQIRSELQLIWDEGNPERTKFYGDYSSYDDKQDPPGSLSRIVFKVWSLYNRKVRKVFPTLYSFAKRHPEVTSCSMNKIIPGTILKNHYGETNGILRIHLGLKIPGDKPPLCGMEVKGEKVFWEDGKAFGFLDAHPHYVWNNSNSERYIIIVDILQPQFYSRKNFICARIIVGQLFFSTAVRFLNEKQLKKVPAWLLNGIAYLLFIPIMLAVSVNNRLGIIKI